MPRSSLVVAILAIALCLMMLAQPMVSSQGALPFTPHEEPSAALSLADSLSLLRYYADAFRMMSPQDIEGMRALLQKFGFVHLPDSLTSMFNGYTRDTNDTSSSLSEVDRLINNASEQLDQNRIGEANQTLAEASMAIAETQILLNELEDSTYDVGDKLGASTSPQGSDKRLAYEDMLASLARTQDLLNSYLDMLKTLRAMLDRSSQGQANTTGLVLAPTSITLELDATEALLGASVGFRGLLASNATGMANRTVYLFMDGEQIASPVTAADGSYSSAFTVPYKYATRATLYAMYIPEGEDALNYSSALSQPAYLTLLFNNTYIELSYTSPAYPGLGFNLSARVSGEGNSTLTGRAINLFLDGNAVGSGISDENGVFGVSLTLDASTAVGTHQVQAEASPNGTFSGASRTAAFTIIKMATNLTCSYPTFILMPSGAFISGQLFTASNSTPLENASISLSLGNSNASASTTNGSFSADIDVPWGLWIIGYQRLSVNATPAEPYLATSQFSANVMVLNAPLLATLMAAVGGAGWFSLSRIRGFRKSLGRGATETTVIAQTNAAAPALDGDPLELSPSYSQGRTMAEFPGTPSKLSAQRKMVIDQYMQSARLVGEHTGIGMAPYTTLGEFLTLTKPKLNGLAEPFGELTVLAEKSLYSENDPVPKDLDFAVKQARTIRETFTHGTT